MINLIRNYFGKRNFLKKINKCIPLEVFANKVESLGIDKFSFLTYTRQLRQDFKSVYVNIDKKNQEPIVIYKNILLIDYKALLWALEKQVPISIK